MGTHSPREMLKIFQMLVIANLIICEHTGMTLIYLSAWRLSALLVEVEIFLQLHGEFQPELRVSLAP